MVTSPRAHMHTRTRSGHCDVSPWGFWMNSQSVIYSPKELHTLILSDRYRWRLNDECEGKAREAGVKRMREARS